MARQNKRERPALLWGLLALMLSGVLLWARPGREGPAVATLPPTPSAEVTPAPAPTPDPYRNGKAQFDVSQLSAGVVRARYTGGEELRVKVQITKEGGIDYNYDLKRDGEFETYPLTEGEGAYTLRVLEQLAGNRYLPVLTCPVTLILDDPMGPFLRPNQFVNYGLAVADLAAQVTAAGETDADKIALALDYVVETLTYDGDKAGTVEPGYLPDLEAVLDGKKGICLDYAALLCALLRSQGIPARLVVGDSGELYHAWVEVWCDTAGEAVGIPIAAGEWTLLDPTFLSEGGEDSRILDYVTNRENYIPRYLY